MSTIMTTRDLRYYASAVGVHPADVEELLGKRISIYRLKKHELVQLHQKLGDRSPLNHRGFLLPLEKMG